MKLRLGYNHSFEIRRETCVANCKDNFSIVYLSDLHLNGFSKSISENISATIDELNPTVILLGGDYIDSKKGLIYLNNLLRSLSHRQNIFAIAGNHDYYYGIEEIKNSMTENKIVWLENKTAGLILGNTKIKIESPRQ